MAKGGAAKHESKVESFTDLYQKIVGPGSWGAAFIAGHLAIEFLLRTLVGQYDPNLTRLADDLNHARLIELNEELGTITKPQRDVLVQINAFRNRLAHRISFEPTIAEFVALYKAAAGAFDDLSDGISQGLEALTEATSVTDLDEWVIVELFTQIAYDLHNAYIERGGNHETF